MPLNGSLLLRPAQLDDADLLTSLIRAGFAEYDGVLDPPSGAHTEDVDKIRAKLEKGGGLLAYIGQDCAGCVLFYPEDGFLYLGRLAVLSAYRKLGVGQALVEAVEAKAVELGLSGVQLAVRIALPRNRAWFESMGYQVVGYHTHAGYPSPTYMTLEKRCS